MRGLPEPSSMPLGSPSMDFVEQFQGKQALTKHVKKQIQCRMTNFGLEIITHSFL